MLLYRWIWCFMGGCLFSFWGCFCLKNQKPTKEWKPEAVFHKQLLLDTVLKHFGYRFCLLPFEMIKIESCCTAVSRKIEIGCKFNSCVNQTTYNFFTAHNLKHLFHNPPTHNNFFKSHSSTKHTLYVLVFIVFSKKKVTYQMRHNSRLLWMLLSLSLNKSNLRIVWYQTF